VTKPEMSDKKYSNIVYKMRGTRSYKRKTIKKKGGMFDRMTSIGRTIIPMTPAAEEAAEIRRQARDADEALEFTASPPKEYKIVRDPTAGRWTKSYCCDSKTSGFTVRGGDNVGSNCVPSTTGFCNPWQSKFRCFDPQNVNLHKIKEGKDKTTGLRNPGECQLISGIPTKMSQAAFPVTVPLGVVARGVGRGIGAAAQMFGEGGKKKRSNKTKKGARRNSRRYRRSRSKR
jgi:hypothetical protein